MFANEPVKLLATYSYENTFEQNTQIKNVESEGYAENPIAYMLLPPWNNNTIIHYQLLYVVDQNNNKTNYNLSESIKITDIPN